MNNPNKLSGVIFDLHRFSLNDGPGIRTTVFLKGCPLKCIWCHNPESQSFKPQLSYNAEKCTHCMECVKVCPSGAHKNINDKHVLDWNSCNTNNACVNVCNSGALKIVGKSISAGEIITEVLKDQSYYKKSNGGLTISGGEPLAQFEFTKGLLIEAKKHGIHTCVDTCGFAPQRKYKEILPYVDLFLFDYKITNDDDHMKYTGVSNKTIISNLEFLYNNGASIILRCPVIPGINDNEKHFAEIKKIATIYSNLKLIEIMPYHAMGRDKSERIGKEFLLPELKTCDESLKEKWKDIFSEYNSKILIN